MAECILLKSGGDTDSDDCTATKANVLSGYTAVTKDSDDEAMAGTMANKGAWTSRIGVNGKAIIPAGYHNGSGYVDQAITNRGAVNASLAINGTYTIPEGYHNGAGKVTQSIATMGAQTITPGNSQKVVSCSGKYMTGNVTVPAVVNLTAANIKKGVNVGGVVGTYEGWYSGGGITYSNGANDGQWTPIASGGTFYTIMDTGQITVKEQTAINNYVALQSRTYNLSAFHKLTISGSFRQTSKSANLKWELVGNSTALGGWYTVVENYNSVTIEFDAAITAVLKIKIPRYCSGYIKQIILS